MDLHTVIKKYSGHDLEMLGVIGFRKQACGCFVFIDCCDVWMLFRSDV